MYQLKLDIEIKGGEAVPRYKYEFCPVNYVRNEHFTMISLHRLWRKGKMLFSGGIAEQPARYVDIMMFLDGVLAKYENELIEGMKN